MSDMYDFDGEFQQTYSKVCKGCGTEMKVSTQRDQHPEYYTNVFVKCSCGESVGFSLPVN